MDKKLLDSLDISKPYEWLAIELRANISEDWDLLDDLEWSDDIKKIAFQIIFAETVKRTYRTLDEKLRSK